jgi:tetratricopeptide (TPR) repeat protein
LTLTKADWSDLKGVVADALNLPARSRSARLARDCRHPEQLAEATRLLRACERAAANSILDLPAAQFATSILAEVQAGEDGVPEELQAALAGRYTIERELGRGGMATVYLARDERHGRPVALKLLRAAFALDDDTEPAAGRFQREIEIAAGLSHPHILPLHDSGEAAGWLYYIMPYVPGATLAEHLRRSGRLPLVESLRLLRDVARALAHAHRHGTVHCDIKPANILLTAEGDALVADFGVARALAAVHGSDGKPVAVSGDGAVVFGTPAYMAPEQVAGDAAVDQRADLYAFGVVAYELLTGRPPFADRSRHAQLSAHLHEVPEPVALRQPDVPVPLAGLVDRLLAKRPGDRPGTATEVLELLDRVLASPAALARDEAMAGAPPQTEAPRAGRWVERGSDNQEAYELYLKGRHLSGTRQREGLLRALRYFEAAVERDPAYAQAWASMADARTFLGIFGHLPPHEALPKARAEAEHAISLDGQLVEARTTLAHLLFVYDWNWPAAEAAFERVLGLAPIYPTLLTYYASLLHSVGRPEEALAQLAAARGHDPLLPIALLSGRIYVDTHRPDEAIEVLQEQIELDPRLDLAHQLLAHAYLQKGRSEEAIDSMRRAAGLSGPRDRAQLAYVHAKTGDPGEARRLLDGLYEDSEALDLLGFHLAMAYGHLGEPDEAFRWLEAAYTQRGSFMNLLAVATGFGPLRSDLRFDELLRRMGLR